MRYMFKTRYEQDIGLARHSGDVFWYGLLVIVLLFIPGVMGEFYVGELGGVFIFAITGVLALGVTATLVVGGFDLSIGSVATSAMMAAAYVMVVLEQNAVVAVVVCLLIGAVVGLINGWLIVYMRVPDLLDLRICHAPDIDP